DGMACDVVEQKCKACAPVTCDAVGAQCGTISNGCGGTLTCGTANGACPAGKICVSNQCRPAAPPSECTQQRKNCGTITNACTGAAVTCGNCAVGEVCVDNICKSCIPKSCSEQGLQCGSGSDGCGGTLSCGMCPNTQVCYNKQCCTPTTCEAQGKNCGK